MPNRDVELRIRARETASKAIKEVGLALDQLAAAQEDVAKRAGSSGSLVGQLGSEFSKLKTDLQGLDELARVSRDLAALDSTLKSSAQSIRDSRNNISRATEQYGRASQSIRVLRDDLAKTNQQITEQQNALKRPRSEFRKLERQLDTASRRYRELESSIKGTEDVSAETVASLREQGNALKVLERQLRSANGPLQEQERTLKELRETRKSETASLRSVETVQRRLRKEIEKSNVSISKQNNTVRSTRSEYRNLSETSDRLRASLGGIAGTQESVANASRNAVNDVQRLTEAFERQARVQTGSNAGQGPAASATRQYRQQVQAVREAQQAFKEARAEATRLGQQFAQTANPTQQLRTSFVLAREASAQAEASYRNQANSLNQLRGVVQGSFSSFSRYATSVSQSTLATQNFSRGASRASGQLQRLSAAFRGLTSSASGFRNVILGAGAALLSLSSSTNTAGNAIRSIRGQVLGLTAAYLGFFAAFRQIEEVLTAFQTLEAAQNRLGVIFDGDANRVTQEIRFLRSEASRLGVEFGVLSQEYSKFAVAASTAGFAQESIREIFLSVAEAGRVNKLSTEDISGTFLALTQIVGKGRFSLEELRQQLGERLPGSLQILAKSLDITTQELFNLVESGELVASEDNLLKFAGGFRDAFGSQLEEALKSTSAEIGRFSNNVFSLRNSVAQGGFIDAFTSALRKLNDELASDGGRRFFQSVGAGLANIVDLGVVAAENIGLLVTAFQVFIALRIRTKILSIVGGQNELAASLRFVGQLAVQAANRIAVFLASLSVARIRAFGASIVGLVTSLRNLRGGLTGLATTARGAILSLGGLSGVLAALLPIALAVAAVFAPGLLLDYISEVDEATEANLDFEASLQKISDAVANAQGDLEKAAATIEDISEVQIRDNLDVFKSRLEEVNEELDISTLFASFGDDLKPAQDAIRGLIEQYEQGAISSGELQARTLELLIEVEKINPTMGQFASVTRDLIREKIKLTENVEQAEASLSFLNGTITETQKASLGLADANREVSESLTDVGINVGRYEKNLNKLIRATSEGRKRLQQEEIRNNANEARAALVENGLQSFDPNLLAQVDDAEKAALAQLNRKNTRATRTVKITDEERAARKRVADQLRLNNQLLAESERRQFELRQLSVDDERQRTINEAVERASSNAKRRNLELTREQVQLIERETEALFDAQNARRPLEEAEKRVNELLETRTLLQERIQFLRQQGDANSIEAANVLEERIQGVEAQTQAAVQEAVKLARAFGDENLALELENIGLSIEEVGKKAIITGEQLNNSLANGGAQVLEKFAQSIANGENALQSLGDATRQFVSDFLIQIARAIAQQAILNALQAGGSPGAAGGGGFGGFIAGVASSIFHEGGIAGGSAPARTVPASYFNKARRYHEGGIAGLRPNEVPAILERNEEVLTETDPRHRNNGGGAGMNVKVVNTIDAGSFVSEGLSTTEGEQSVLNFMKANSSAVRGAIGV